MKLISLINPLTDFNELAALCKPEDALLLRQDAVYLCLRTDMPWPVSQCYALDIDVQSRNITLPDSVQLINAAQWVELVVQAEVNLLWPS
ncbi:DsrH/TusB family sulfur metabolism protein [Rheinheimera sp. FR7-31]|uniref:DsrH/TusB family sulfur metabolism protein n=1 Tax=Rheinheimera fenheensis TaxID=3152295 RepID=UPI00325D2D34